MKTGHFSSIHYVYYTLYSGGERMKKKCRPLCETPRSNIFCGPDKYLQLQEYTISQEMFPVLEIDSYFILVREGKGVFIINGEEFSVEPGCVSWIQGSQMLTICPNFGEQLHIWVCAYDYQLLSYYTFNKISLNVEAEIVNGLPVVGPDGEGMDALVRLFCQFRELAKKNTRGSTIIRSSFLRKIELLYNRVTHSMKGQYKFENMPLGRQASLYMATHSTKDLTAAQVAKDIGPKVTEAALNHALLVATGLNFNQYLNRLRLVLATSFFLYDSLPFDYIASISGFNMEITFFRRFKALTGVTPQTYREQMLCNGKNGKVYRGMIMSETLISVISYLYENMTEYIDVDILARELYTSGNILRIQFKSRLNTSFKQILSQFRVRYAEALLTTTDLPTVDIAIESGFGSGRTMGRVFYDINGMSPGEFRKRRCGGRENNV